MASTSSVQDIEGQNSGRPPFFIGINYGYWKCRMMIFLKDIDLMVCKIMESPYTPPTTEFEHCTDDAKRKANLNAKAMNALYCAIDQSEFNRISICSTAHEI